MIMKTSRILYTLAAAAVAFGFTACADTDAQYTIPDVDSPQFVNSVPEAGSGKVKCGDITVTVKYDKRIFFATQDKDKIQVTGATLQNAIVYGTDSVLTMTVNCPERGRDVTVVVPEGVVTNGQGKPAAEVTVSFSTVGIDETPVMAKSASAIKLYNYLVENVDSKIISGMMADVAWNNNCSEQVYGWTGKYPAINGYDYIHMPASEAGANWIDYTDITPVREWADNGGIVAMTWHWLVPKTAVSTSSEVSEGTPVWTGSFPIGDSWGGQSITDGLTEVKAGNVLRLFFNQDPAFTYWQLKVMDGNWTTLTSYQERDNGWGCIELAAGAAYCDIVLNEDDAAAINGSGIIVSGYGVTVTKVSLLDAAEAPQYSSLDPNNDFTYSIDETSFDAANALTEGTWENYVWKHDMAVLIKYLTLLKDAGIPVLWRPFHEASGQWFWWGKDADAFKNLWIEMFKEMSAAGLDNLIWVWTSCGSDNGWYPGDAYVDVVARDLYGDSESSCVSEYSDLGATYGNKIITLGECGWSEYANNNEGGRIATITEQWNAGALWSWFMVWYDGGDAANKHADEAWWKDAMGNPNVITRDQVPALR